MICINISVVIPVYNMENSLEKCLESILNQTYKDFELILVDDGSTDDSLKICKEIATKDSRIKVLHTKNRGSGPARNSGIEKATGKYIYFPDADDELNKDSFSLLSKLIKNNSYDLIVFGYKILNSKGSFVKEKKYNPTEVDGDTARNSYLPYITMDSSFGIQGAPWNKLFKLDLIKDKKIFFPPLRRHQDDAFIGKYMCYANKIKFIDEILYTYNLNDLSKEWDKYPVDYLKAVLDLNKIRKETIMLWNEEDLRVHEILKCEFICNFIKALELNFSPKMNLKTKSRFKEIKKNVNNENIKQIIFPNVDGYYYQKKVIKYINSGNYFKLYILLKSKVFAQKNLYSIFLIIKKLFELKFLRF